MLTIGPHTMDDWRTTPEERLELINGHFRELPLFTGKHQLLSGKLCGLFNDLGDRCAVPQVGLEVSVERRIALAPDVVVVNTWPCGDYPVPEQVDLVVEVWSPEDTAEDREYRQRTYASVGIPYFWTVDQDSLVITGYELRDEEYREQATLRPGTTGTIMAAPTSMTFDPAELWRW